MRENIKTDREETFRFYLDKILDAMNVSSIDYDNLTYRQIAIITHWVKNLTLVKDKEA